MSANHIKVVFGTAGALFTEATAPEIYRELLKNGVTTLDTAQLYEGKEEVIGNTSGGDSFVIDSKEMGGFNPKTATKQTVLQRGKESMEKLKAKQLDVFYIHAPERQIPLEDTLAGIDELHKAGMFKRFGLSNFQAAEVEEVFRVCGEKGFVVPSVYQGNYSAVARLQEDVLFPTLRKHNMAFYAYSPLAGGFLTKTKEDIELKASGRFRDDNFIGNVYLKLFDKPTYLEALATWNAIAQGHGIGKAEMAYRWVAFNSALSVSRGDALIIGASRMEQLKESLAWFKKGPLPESAVKAIQEVWESIKGEASLDTFNQ